MIKSNEYLAQSMGQINDQLIMNPFELFVHELQTKDINSKKQSIQTLHVIGLTMSQQEIINQLLPFLMKLLIEQNSKEIKLSIVKSLRNIFPLLLSQKSFLNFIQMLLDFLVVFDEKDLRLQAFSVLSLVLYQFDALEFQRFKETFKKLATQELISIADPIIGRNAKQLALYLIKYLMKHSWKLNEKQNKEIIDFLKENYLCSTDNDYLNLKIISENFQILVSEWPSVSISHLYEFINFFIGGQPILEKKNNEQVQKTEEKIDQTTQTSQQVKQPIPNYTILPKEVSSELKTNLITSLIALAKKDNPTKAFSYIQRLLQEQDSKIKISLIRKTKQIFNTFATQDLQSLLCIFSNFSQQGQDIKKAILQVLDDIPFEDQKSKESILGICKNAIQLKNILIQSLIRNNKSQSVSEILIQSDYDFKIKIFMKLPDSLLHQNTLYAQIIDSLLSQPKKNFRSKLNIILNLISRIETKSKSKIQLTSQFDISYLILPLVKYLGDKIAIIRVNVAKLCALLLFNYNIDFQSVSSQLNDIFYGESKGWFQRQTVLIMIKEYLLVQHETINLNIKTNTGTELRNKNVNHQFIQFAKKTLKDGTQGFIGKNSDNQTQKIVITNITSLAFQIIRTFSIQI